MSNEEAKKVLKELEEVRPEKLNDKAKRLFEAIILIADKKEKAESDLYEANNRINDLLDLVKQKDKIIREMADYIKNPSKSVYLPQIFKARMDKREAIIKYFEERCNNAKD